MKKHAGSKRSKRLLLTAVCLGLLIMGISACEFDPPAPAPTVAPFFSTITPIPTRIPRVELTVTPIPTLTPNVPPTPTRSIYQTDTIYDDAVRAGWTLTGTQSMVYDTDNRTYAYSGDQAVRLQPRLDFATFYVALNENGRVYPREDVISVSFYLHGGDGYIETDDLFVTMQGSNDRAYWQLNDTSARTAPGPIFSESELTFLQINQAIPPETWVQVEVILDDLQFDPPYRYVTGFYIKNNRQFLQPFYVDQIEIVTLAEGTDE